MQAITFVLGLNKNSIDCWGPVVNLNRDPRWGRNGEGGLEDAYAMGELAKAWTLGFQSPRPSLHNRSRMLHQGIITLKHMASTAQHALPPVASRAHGIDTLNCPSDGPRLSAAGSDAVARCWGQAPEDAQG